MTSGAKPTKDHPRRHRQKPVESASLPPPLTLDRMRCDEETAADELGEDSLRRSGPIPDPGGLNPQAVKPILLDLTGKRRQPSAMKDLLSEGLEDRLDRIPEPRPEAGRPQSMNRPAIFATVLDRPEREDMPLKIAKNVAVNPDPTSLTTRTSPRPRPRISPAFLRQPLYIRPKIEYQYSAVGRLAGEDMFATCPGQPSLFLSTESATDHPLYKTS